MIFGTIFEREAVTMPRRPKHFFYRAISVVGLFVVICTTWLLLAGIQPLSNLGDLSRFSSLIFQILAPLQLVLLMFVSCLAGCTAVSHEKDRRTLILLLMTTLSNWEVVFGKVSSGLLAGINLLFSGTLALIVLSLFGGVAPFQVFEIGLIALSTIVASSAWGAMVALWRDKTFQAIAVSLLGLMLYLGIAETIAVRNLFGLDQEVAQILSPIRSTIVASRPIPEALTIGRWNPVFGSCAWMLTLGTLFCTLSVARLRVWNPSREGLAKADDIEDVENVRANISQTEAKNTDQMRAWRARRPRRVWDNPILWREVCTWAYGRKVLLIKFSYLAFGLLIAIGLQASISEKSVVKIGVSSERFVPASAQLLGTLLVVSMIVINALAVNSITNERDGQALDLLLVSEITPRKFLFGKLLGVLYVAKEMVLLPMAFSVWLWLAKVISGENLCFLTVDLMVVDIFVVMLGLHCGMIYSRSSTAIATSLGTVFFLFLGVLTCMLIMISFRGSFGRQLAPFLAIILGGGTGLYVAMGYRNPSPAIALAAFGLPFMTFFAITSFILRGQELTVFSSVAAAYGFATLAMMVPALSEFEFSFGRSQATQD